MTRKDRNFLHVAMALTTITGIVFAIMRYGMKTDDPFAVANHPWQPYMLDAHVVVAPLLLFALGLIFRTHIWRKYRSHKAPGRRSGSSAMWLIVPMVFSGYLLQVSTNENVRRGMAIVHWITSGIFALVYLVHQFTKKTTTPGG